MQLYIQINGINRQAIISLTKGKPYQSVAKVHCHEDEISEKISAAGWGEYATEAKWRIFPPAR